MESKMNKCLISFALLLLNNAMTQAGVTNRHGNEIITKYGKPYIVLPDEFPGRCDDPKAPCGCKDVKRIEFVKGTGIEITEHVCTAERHERGGLVCRQEMRYRSVSDDIDAIPIKTGCELRFIGPIF